MQNPDPRRMQINLTGFLNGKNARIFMSELWDLLLSAQESSSGIPEIFMAQKKEEIKKRMVFFFKINHLLLKLIIEKDMYWLLIWTWMSKGGTNSHTRDDQEKRTRASGQQR